jgi:hypothetical protein
MSMLMMVTVGRSMSVDVSSHCKNDFASCHQMAFECQSNLKSSIGSTGPRPNQNYCQRNYERNSTNVSL